MEMVETAVSLFSQGFSCSQAVLLAFAPRFGLEPRLSACLASAFGGGIARQGQVCGAITGAAMVAGLHGGSATAEDRESKEAVYERVRNLMARFAAAHGTTECRQLTGFNLATPEGHAAATEAGIFTTRCPGYVRTAASLVLELIANKPADSSQ